MIKNNCTCDSKGRYNKGEISPKKLWKSEVGKKKTKHSRRYNRKRKTSTFKESHDLKLDMVKICKDFLCMKLKTCM